MGHQRSTDEINQLIKGYRQRGELTRRAFCESQGISLPTLDYYLRRYGRPVEATVRLAKVEVEVASTAERFSLVLANGRRIECGEAGLEQLIRIAEVS
jgi:hypothetical protein